MSWCFGTKKPPFTLWSRFETGQMFLTACVDITFVALSKRNISDRFAKGSMNAIYVWQLLCCFQTDAFLLWIAAGGTILGVPLKSCCDPNFLPPPTPLITFYISYQTNRLEGFFSLRVTNLHTVTVTPRRDILVVPFPVAWHVGTDSFEFFQP